MGDRMCVRRLLFIRLFVVLEMTYLLVLGIREACCSARSTPAVHGTLLGCELSSRSSQMLRDLRYWCVDHRLPSVHPGFVGQAEVSFVFSIR